LVEQSEEFLLYLGIFFCVLFTVFFRVLFTVLLVNAHVRKAKCVRRSCRTVAAAEVLLGPEDGGGGGGGGSAADGGPLDLVVEVVLFEAEAELELLGGSALVGAGGAFVSLFEADEDEPPEDE